MKADLRGPGSADLRDAGLGGENSALPQLKGANLTGASLDGANMSKGVFILTDFTGANLSGIMAHDADNFGDNLSQADLRDVRLRNAKFDLMGHD